MGIWIIQTVDCNSSSDTSASEAEIELTLQAIYAENTAQAQADAAVVEAQTNLSIFFI